MMGGQLGCRRSVRGGRIAAFGRMILLLFRRCQSLLKCTAGFEPYASACRDLDGFQRGWILPNTLSAVAGFKHSKITKFQAIALFQFANNLIEKRLHGSPDHKPAYFVSAGDAVYQLFFGYSGHGSPFSLTLKPPNVSPRSVVFTINCSVALCGGLNQASR
jgi:hypothetical protein